MVRSENMFKLKRWWTKIKKYEKGEFLIKWYLQGVKILK